MFYHPTKPGSRPRASNPPPSNQMKSKDQPPAETPQPPTPQPVAPENPPSPTPAVTAEEKPGIPKNWEKVELAVAPDGSGVHVVSGNPVITEAIQAWFKAWNSDPERQLGILRANLTQEDVMITYKVILHRGQKVCAKSEAFGILQGFFTPEGAFQSRQNLEQALTTHASPLRAAVAKVFETEFPNAARSKLRTQPGMAQVIPIDSVPEGGLPPDSDEPKS